MRIISLKIPEMAEIDNLQLYMILASGLYEQGKLSLGQAAEVANLSKRTFAELLGSYGVSLFNYPATDLIQDVANAGSYAV
jgi:predicted HTH domain antitoxin